jgi:Mn-dependent DtxR family transcriptional regulator
MRKTEQKKGSGELLVHRLFELLLLQKLEYQKHQFSAQGSHGESSNLKHKINLDLLTPIFNFIHKTKKK